MNKFRLFFLSVLSALIFACAWPVFGFSFLIFFAFVPLFFVEEIISESNSKRKVLKLFGYSYLVFFLWNILTTWWIYNASLGGAALAIIANALLMSLVYLFYFQVKRRTKTGFVSLICFWLAFEYLHLNWDLSWPWLTLGNVFSLNYQWVQWYEFTGVLGGSFWILCVNILFYSVFKFLHSTADKKQKIYKLSSLLGLIFIPIGLSYLIYYSKTLPEQGSGVPVVVVQPNIDPYNEKFGGMSDIEQLEKLFALAIPELDSTTAYLIAPETAIASNIWENKIENAPAIIYVKSFLKKYPKLKIVIGASTALAYIDGARPSATARKFTQEDGYYDSYNTALQIDSNTPMQIYHKSKLVPGVEKIPFPILFKPLENFAIDLGGTTGSLGIQEERTVFYDSSKKLGIAPVICYESIYGEFVGDYIKKGANLIFIITNDGWWGDTPGYKQHLTFASLRAIETRCYIARSANTGTSAIINSRGDISQKTDYWKEAIFKAEVFKNDEHTFYVKYGDYIGKIAALCSLFMLLFYLYLKLKKSSSY
jgi:apolipoprotein N-acyltransferase